MEPADQVRAQGEWHGAVPRFAPRNETDAKAGAATLADMNGSSLPASPA
jgi:hypothetical protein